MNFIIWEDEKVSTKYTVEADTKEQAKERHDEGKSTKLRSDSSLTETSIEVEPIYKMRKLK